MGCAERESLSVINGGFTVAIFSGHPIPLLHTYDDRATVRVTATGVLYCDRAAREIRKRGWKWSD